MYKIAIIENQPIFREGLFSYLSKGSEFNVVCQYNDPISFLRRKEGLTPDVVILDMNMPKMNGIEAIEEIKKRWPHIKILIITNKLDMLCIQNAFRAGADGYLDKSAPANEISSAISIILGNKPYVSSEILKMLINNLINFTESESSFNHKLTVRERELFKLISEGYKNKEVADALCISVKTVEAHRNNLMRKLNVRNVVELTHAANRMGIIYP